MGRAAETNYVLKLGGTNGCLEIQSGAFANLTEATMEGWVKWNGGTSWWGRFFDFGRANASINVSRYSDTTNLNFEVFSAGRQSYVVAPGIFKTN